MKIQTIIYKKWNYLIFLNNLTMINFGLNNQKLTFLKMDIYKKTHWIYKKKLINFKITIKNILKIFYI